MGSCLSGEAKIFTPKEGVPGQDKVAYDVMLKILAVDDINKLWTAYCDIDADESGYIRSDEFRAYFHIEKNMFNEKLFGMFDADASGYLNFFEFVCSIWNFLSTDPNDLGGFAFYLFDDDKSGSMDMKEVKSMLEHIHSGDPTRLRRIHDELSTMPYFIPLDDFVRFTRSTPMITNPILILQLKLQQELIGTKFWKRMTADRNEDLEKKDPGYILRVSARAAAIYKVVMDQIKSQDKIQKMRDSVSLKANGIRVSDKKTQKRNSLILGLMKMKEVAKPASRKEVKFDSEKYRDAQSNPEEGPKSKGKVKPVIKSLMGDEETYVDSVGDESKAKPKQAKSPSRKTVVVSGTSKDAHKNDSQVSEKKNDSNDTDKKASKKSRQTLPPVKHPGVDQLTTKK